MIFLHMRRRLAGIADYDRLPGLVIVDLSPQLASYLEAVADINEEAEAQLDAFLGDLFMYLRDQQMAEVGLQALHDDVLNLYHRRNRHEGEQVAQASRLLAKDVLEQLKALGMYTPEGLMPYFFAKRPRMDEVHLERYDAKEAQQPKREINFHHCRVVYASGNREQGQFSSGDSMEYEVEPKDLSRFVFATKTKRPDAAIFVDGQCIHRGYLTDEQLKEELQELARRPSWRYLRSTF